MTELGNGYLFSYEENEKLTSQIEEIVAENTSSLTKIKRLKSLYSTVYAPISKCHVEYYINKLREARRTSILRFIGAGITAAYLVFTLFRIFWYLNPEKNPFASAKSISISDLIVFLYLIPVAMAAYFLLKLFFKKKR